jgi:hypothetical protein
MAQPTSLLRPAMLAVSLVVLSACGAATPTDPGGQPGPTATSLQFTTLPVAYSPLRGNFGVTQGGYHSVSANPIRPYLTFFSGGPTPTDVAIYAPASGHVISASRDDVSGRQRLDVLAAGGHRYYLTGGAVTFSVSPGAAIAAGQVVGTRTVEFRQGASSVSLGVIHPTRRVGFISPDRYTDDVLHAVSPVDYYAEPMRGLIMTALDPTNTALELNYDIPGRLQGFWYLPSIPRSQSTSSAHSAGWLWFHKTVNAQSRGLSGFSIVAPFAPAVAQDTFYLEADSGPAFAEVSPASGVVTYRFPYSSDNAVVIRVQMLSDTSVRAEKYDSYSGLPAGFTANAQVFIR